MRKISFLLLAVFLLASCSQEVVDSPITPQNEVKVPITFHTTPMETKIVGEKGVETRSVVSTDVDENGIVDMWVVQFDKDGNFIKKVYNPAVNKDAFDASLVATPATQVSHLYFLANIGPTLISPDNETSFATQVKFITTEDDIFLVSGGKKYLPMYGSKLDVMIPYTGFIDKLDATLKRVVAKVKVVCNVDAAVLSKLNMESASLCNVPMGLQFCPPTGGTPTTTTSTFNMKPEAITLSSNAVTLLYYLPENLRGVGTNTTGGERLKIGIDNATYVEILGRTIGFNGGEEVGYRIYLGADATNDYNLARNMSYEVTTTLKGISPSDQRVRIHERSNCYIVAPGSSIRIPVKRANDSPEMGIQIPDVTDAWTPMVYWQTAGGLVKVSRTAGDGFFTVTAPNNTIEGNALVVVKNAGHDVLWSWHIWVMKADINYPSNQFTTNGFTFMDRNIGATDPGVFGVTNSLFFDTSAGLLYQWGRKDPFITGKSLGDNSSTAVLYNATGTLFLPSATYNSLGLTTNISGTNDAYTRWLDITYPTAGVGGAPVGYEQALKYSIMFPALHIKNWMGSTSLGSGANIVLNATNGSESWGGEYGQPKSVYDPCPEGWRVPSYKKTSSSVAASLFGGSQGITSAITPAMNAYNYISVGSSGILFPFCGYRNESTGQLSAIGSYTFLWGATAEPSTRKAYNSHFSVSPTYSNRYADERSRSCSVRCVKNW